MRECTNARMRKSRLALAFLHLCVLAFLASGCGRLHAKAAAEPPSLDVPAPPARTVEPVEAKAPPGPEEPARPAARPAPPAAVTARPVPAEPPKAADEPPRTPTTLQTTPSNVEGEIERVVRATLARASSDLSRVDYRRLNAGARTQYDTAKRFIQQAGEAIQAKNLVFAKNLADKAAALAAQLAGK